jgi:hypothetical protein
MDVQSAVTTIETAANWAAANFPHETVDLLFLAVSPFISVFLKAVATGQDMRVFWFTIKGDDVKRMFALMIAIIAVGINYLLTEPSVGAQFIVVQGVLLHTLNQPYFKVIIKPLTSALAVKWAAAKTLNTSEKAAIVPLVGLPISTPTPTYVDPFSS